MGSISNDTIIKGVIIFLGILLVIYTVKKLLNFLGFTTKFSWGIFNYWIVKRSRHLSFEEMRILKQIAEEFKILAPSYLVGKLSSLDYYLRFYVNTILKKNMNYWSKMQTLGKVLEVRRKFAIVPIAVTRIRNSRQFPPGTKIKVLIKGKGFFSAVIGENGYSTFTVTVPNAKTAELLKREHSVKCSVNRIGDGSYSFFSKIGFVSASTNPMFMQLKQSRNLKRDQLRRDIRQKTDVMSDVVPAKVVKSKKGYVFSEVGRDKYSGMIQDISSGGAAVSLYTPLKPGDYFKIKFKLLGESVEVPARLLRFKKVRQHSDSGTGHFRFTGIPLRARVMIQLYTYRLHPTYLKKKTVIPSE